MFLATVGRTILQVVLLGAVALVLGAVANSVRGSGSLKWTKNYFDRGEAVVPAPEADISPAETPQPSTEDDVVETDAQETAPKSALPAHNFNTISLEEVIRVFESPDTANGLNVFIDARTENAFKEGHIPGAIQCFPFAIEECIDEVLQYATAAFKIVVYCTGGDCEDSIFMCRELLEAGLASDNIYLFEGGWHEWSESDQPIQTGPE